MDKSFLSVSPSEGNGNTQVNISVKENFSLEKRSESLNIRTANGIEKQVRIFQEPGMFFFPTMVLLGIKPGQGKEEFTPLDHYPVISPQSDKNWLVDSINIRPLLSKFMNDGGLLVFRLRVIMKRSFWENYTPEVNQGGAFNSPLEDKSEELYSIDEFWYLKDDWVYVGCDWNMDSSEGSHIPSATLDYVNEEGEYETLFEWRFSADSMDLLPQ